MSKVRVEFKVVALVLLVLFPLAYFSLSHVPSLYIDSVMLSISEEEMATPYALKGALVEYRGKSLVSLSLKKVRRELESLALVDSVRLKKKFPSTLLVEATLVGTLALVYAKNAEDQTVAVYVLRSGALLPLQREDWTLFEDKLMDLSVNIPLEQALDLGWEILAECFEPNETGLKSDLILNRWPNKSVD